MQPLISHLTARVILDSRGLPTVETTCHLTNGSKTVASVPSVDSAENVVTYISNVINYLSPLVAGESPLNQVALDHSFVKADGTVNKSRFGANAIMSASMAICKAGALVKKIPLYQHLAFLSDNDQLLFIPSPYFNVLSGGQASGGNLDFQEFLIVANPTKNFLFPQILEMGSHLNQAIKLLLKQKHLNLGTMEEGGFAPVLKANHHAIELIVTALKNIGLAYTQDFYIALDFAATKYFNNGKFHLKDSNLPLDLRHYVGYLEKIITDYKPYSFEDPLPPDLWEHWSRFTRFHGHNLLIAGDDLLLTNPKSLLKAINQKACNSVLVKPNQIGTVSEAIEFVSMAKSHHLKTIISQRTGETTDTFIADFAVGVGADHVKFGAPNRGERVVKYNRLLAICQDLS